MSTERNQMIHSLNEIVIPKLRELNFTGKFPHFRRVLGEKLNLLTFQFDRHGGGFVIEIGSCPKEGYQASYDEYIEPEKMTVHHLGADERIRIQQNMKTLDSSTDNWFRYDKKPFLFFGNIYEKVAKDVLKKIVIAEKHWKKGN